MSQETEHQPYFNDTSEFLLKLKLLEAYAPESETTQRLKSLSEKVINAAFPGGYFPANSVDKFHTALPPQEIEVSNDDRAVINEAIFQKTLGPKETTPEYDYALQQLGRWVTDREAASVDNVVYEQVNDHSGVLIIGNPQVADVDAT